jgi:uncharacterized membrane protein (UPF0127 family)
VQRACGFLSLRKRALIAAAVVAVGLSVAFLGWAQAAGKATIEIVSKTGVHAFSVELATNDAERERGLMFVKQLPEGQGMLFDFQQDEQVSFWMHNTYIPLDMLFIGSNGKVLHIAENAKPMSDTLIPSQYAVRFVLEVIAGTADKLGIAVGDKVTGTPIGNSG